mmetsp:Transcript_94173/g.177139  ORF Transcript_94173/g.177139 Transcript_94173/m.177139 type:complete len:590 (-) Transcript_94173:67-1836(-)
MSAKMLMTPALLYLLCVSHVAADEMAWGDVSADGTLETRSLDVPVPMARGVENFFEQDPMSAHDWTHVDVVHNSLRAQISVAAAAKPDSNIRHLEEALRPIYAAMPKDESGLLANGTVRYALHRYFTAKRGWAVKGLPPAGGSWIKSMSVTPDVKEISKYMVPTFLQDVLMKHFGSDATDLQSLAILAATLEHLVHGEMLDILYSIYSTIGLPVAGARNEREIEDIIDLFMMVYAFGFNLETSTHKDMMKALRHLESKHSGWPPLRAFAQDITKKVVMKQASGSNQLDFDGVLQVIEEIGNWYARWQSRDCTKAKELLSDMPSFSAGRVPAEHIVASRADGFRPLFMESAEDLLQLGVLDSEHLVVPNYINSQSMCLSTASFYTACCPNECESLLSSLESSLGAPAAEPKRLDELLSGLAPGNSSRLESLNFIATQNAGMVPLHSRSFAREMHSWFPMQCPLPNDMPNTNPKTADEWMNPPDEKIQDTEDMMSEIAAVLAKYTAMGEYVAPSEEPEDELPTGEEVIVLRQPELGTAFEKQRSSIVVYAVPVISMLGFAVTAVRSGLVATGLAPKHKPKVMSLDSWDSWA